MAQLTVLIDYGSGNLRSAEKALLTAASHLNTEHRVLITSDPAEVLRADRIVLPGVGAFGDCARGLRALAGMEDALTEAVLQKSRPFLGVCVGMQLMARVGHEHGAHQGLGWLDGAVEPLVPHDPALKIPHMGWNEITLTPAGTSHPVAGALENGDHLYFVHSYHMTLQNSDGLYATTDYGCPINAIVGRDNFIGTQFHPEKSQRSGLKFLQAFLEWKV